MHTYRSILVGLSASLLLIYGCAPSRPSGAINPTPGDPSTPSAPAAVPQILPSDTLEPTQTPIPNLELPTPTPQVPIEKVTFTTTDGIQIAGTLFGEGDLPILMLHMGKGKATANDQVDWHPIALRLAEEGYPSLAIDFRGRGESGGDFENDPVILDAQAALEFLHQRGYSRYICLGAGLGGTTCMVMALTEPPAALIVLSSTLSVGPSNQISEEDLTRLDMPKMFIFGERDAFGFPEAMQTIFRHAVEPKSLLTCETAAHGSDLLYGSCGAEIQQDLFSFLQDLK